MPRHAIRRELVDYLTAHEGVDLSLGVRPVIHGHGSPSASIDDSVAERLTVPLDDERWCVRLTCEVPVQLRRQGDALAGAYGCPELLRASVNRDVQEPVCVHVEAIRCPYLRGGRRRVVAVTGEVPRHVLLHLSLRHDAVGVLILEEAYHQLSLLASCQRRE